MMGALLQDRKIKVAQALLGADLPVVRPRPCKGPQVQGQSGPD